jgi:aspartyl/asparaginyl beta-hydroxylase (cupin superfamily)
MGNGMGAFDEREVKHLSASDRKELKRHTLKHLQSSKEIRALMKRKPTLFTGIKQVKTILRKKVNPVRKRMPKK